MRVELIDVRFKKAGTQNPDVKLLEIVYQDEEGQEGIAEVWTPRALQAGMKGDLYDNDKGKKAFRPEGGATGGSTGSRPAYPAGNRAGGKTTYKDKLFEENPVLKARTMAFSYLKDMQIAGGHYQGMKGDELINKMTTDAIAIADKLCAGMIVTRQD